MTLPLVSRYDLHLWDRTSVVLIRRGAAFVLDVLLWGLIFLAGLEVDRHTNWLSDLNGQQIGITIMICWFILSEGFSGTTVGKSAMRLVVVASNGTLPGARRRLLRAFLFWCLIASPSIRAPLMELLSFFAADQRSQTIYGFATWVTIALIPMLTICAGRGTTGLHDLATGTAVVPRTRVTTTASAEQAPMLRLPRHPVMWAVVLGAWATLMSALVIADWRMAFWDNYEDIARKTARSMETHTSMHPLPAALTAPLGITGPQHLVPPALRDSGTTNTAPPDTEDEKIPGNTLSINFETPPQIIADSAMRVQFARQQLARLRAVAPAGIQWIRLEISFHRGFGFAALGQSALFLLDVNNNWIYENPDATRADNAGAARGEWRLRSESKLQRDVSLLIIYGWDFPRVPVYEFPPLQSFDHEM